MSNREENVLVEKFGSATVASLAGKSECALLARRFLVISFERTKSVLVHLEAEKKRAQHFAETLAFVPIVFFLSFWLPKPCIRLLVQHEYIFRGCFGLLVGASLGFPFLRGWWVRWVLAVSMGLFAGWYAPRSIFVRFFGGGEEAFDRLRLVFSFALPLFVGTVLHWGMCLCRRLGFFVKPAAALKELEKELQKALEASSSIKREELDALLREFAPEMGQMLRLLKVEDPDQVHFPSVEDTHIPDTAGMGLPIDFGIDTAGGRHVRDLDKFPHLLIGGATGKGKTNFLCHLIQSLLDGGKADIIVIDPEQVDLDEFAGHANVRFCCELEKATAVLDEVLEEMERRKELLVRAGVKKVEDLASKGIEGVRPIVVVIDELASFVEQKEFLKKLSHMARICRKYRIRIVGGTQRPDAKVIPEQIRANFPVTLAFAVRDRGNAQVLSAPGADKLEEPGVAYLVQGSKQILLKTPLFKSTKGNSSPKDKEAPSLPRVEKISPARTQLEPAESTDPNAFFMEKDELVRLVGPNPQLLGFQEVRPRREDGRVRGFFVRERS